MGIWSVLKIGFGTRDEPTRPAPPSFEHLEPRLLLSADPAGLAGQISPDYLDDQGAAEAAIVVDYEAVAGEAVASGEWLVESEEEIADHGSQPGNEDETESSPNTESQIPNTEALLTTDYPLLNTDYRSLITDSVDSQLLGSIDARGPPAATVNGSTALNDSTYTPNDDSSDLPSEEGTPSDSLQVVIFDSAVSGYESLVDSSNADLQFFVLDADRDGVLQIADILSGFQNISAVHIVSHGAPGQVVLGSSVLSAETLEGYTDALAAWVGP